MSLEMVTILAWRSEELRNKQTFTNQLVRTHLGIHLQLSARRMNRERTIQDLPEYEDLKTPIVYTQVANRAAVQSPLDRIHLGIKRTELVESRHQTHHARRIMS
jgi:hypothetical protein